MINKVSTSERSFNVIIWLRSYKFSSNMWWLSLLLPHTLCPSYRSSKSSLKNSICVVELCKWCRWKTRTRLDKWTIVLPPFKIDIFNGTWTNKINFNIKMIFRCTDYVHNSVLHFKFANVCAKYKKKRKKEKKRGKLTTTHPYIIHRFE